MSLIERPTFSEAVKKDDDPFIPLTDGKIRPFVSIIDPITNGSTGTWSVPLGFKNNLYSLTIEILDDNKGVILVNAYVNDGKVNRQIGEPTGIYDGSGTNAKRFQWTGKIPLSSHLENNLYVDYANYCGETINQVRIIGDID